jgi:rhodanese-related sulfurtransferase
MIRAMIEWLFGGLDASEAREQQEQGALLIDVRQRDEWQEGHAPGAHHIPLAELSPHLQRIPRDREVLFICQVGLRSARAVAQARAGGLHKTSNVRGGMAAWRKAGLPVERPP